MEHISEADIQQANKDYVGTVGISPESFAREVAFAISQPEDVAVNEIIPSDIPGALNCVAATIPPSDGNVEQLFQCESRNDKQCFGIQYFYIVLQILFCFLYYARLGKILNLNGLAAALAREILQ